jgi:PAS domain S-box-containing protein
MATAQHFLMTIVIFPNSGASVQDQVSWVIALITRARRDRPLAYGIGFLCFAIAFAIRYALSYFMPSGYPFLTFFAAVGATSFFSGLWVGYTVAVACLLSAWYFFVPTGNSSAIGSNSDLIGMIAFAAIVSVECVIGNWLNVVLRNNQALNEELKRRITESDTVLNAVPAAIFICDSLDCKSMRGNPAAHSIINVPPGGNLSKTAPPGERPLHFRVLKDGIEIPGEELPVQQAARGKEVQESEFELVFEDGSIRHLLGNATPLRNANGTVRGSVGVFLDITDRKRAEAALRTNTARLAESEARLRLLIDGVKDHALFMLDPDGRIVSWNSGAERLKQYREDEVLGRHFSIFYRPEDIQAGKPEHELRRALEDGRHQEEGWRVRKNGTEFIAEVIITPLFNDAGALRGFGKVIRDITEKKRAEEAERASAARYRAVVDTAVDAIVAIDEIGTIHAFNPAAETLFGYSAMEASGQNVRILMPEPTRSAHDGYLDHYRRTGERKIIGIGRELIGRHKDGTPIPLELAIAEWRDGDKRYFTGIMRDITERKRAEAALREVEAERQFRLLAENIPTLCWMANADSWIFWYNRRWYEYTGTTPEDMEGWGWQSVHHPDELPRVLENWRNSIATGQPFEMVFPLRGADGVYRPFLTRIDPIRDEAGYVVRWFGTNTDITAQREIEAALRHLNERLEQRVRERTVALEAEGARRAEAEARLRQAQKMEAIGQLTGGIAHDFNNLLTVIIGNLDAIRCRLMMALEHHEGDVAVLTATLQRPIDAALRGAGRAAELTHRLLAFGRRQPLEPKILDINKLVPSLAEMMSRTLGETIEVETVLSGGLWRIFVDWNQLENVLLNLVINARDAMPNGGKLTIETANICLDEA